MTKITSIINAPTTTSGAFYGVIRSGLLAALTLLLLGIPARATDVSSTVALEICSAATSPNIAAERLEAAGWRPSEISFSETFERIFIDGATLSLSGDLSSFKFAKSRDQAEILADTLWANQQSLSAQIKILQHSNAVITVSKGRGNLQVNAVHCIYSGPFDPPLLDIVSRVGNADRAAGKVAPIKDVAIANIRQSMPATKSGDIALVDMRIGQYLLPKEPYDGKIPSVEGGFSLFSYSLK